MTYRECLEAVRKTPRDWRLASDGWEIRRGPYSGRNQCPIIKATREVNT